MTTQFKNKSIETDEEGYLLNPEQWTPELAEELVKKYESAGNKPVTETGWELIQYFREYYEDHMKHPSMHRILAERAKIESKKFEDEKSYRDFLYELFPQGPIPVLCKLAGLPNPKHEIET